MDRPERRNPSGFYQYFTTGGVVVLAGLAVVHFLLTHGHYGMFRGVLKVGLRGAATGSAVGFKGGRGCHG